jgi:small subunit ribosomal protein S18
VSSEPARNVSESSRPPSRGSRPAFGGGGGGRPSRPGGGGGGRGGGGGKRYFFRRRKVCKFCADKIDYIDYKDVKLLSQFVPERGKLLPRRMFGTCAEHQRKLTVAIKRARHIALLPFMEV